MGLLHAGAGAEHGPGLGRPRCLAGQPWPWQPSSRHGTAPQRGEHAACPCMGLPMAALAQGDDFSCRQIPAPKPLCRQPPAQAALCRSAGVLTTRRQGQRLGLQTGQR